MNMIRILVLLAIAASASAGEIIQTSTANGETTFIYGGTGSTSVDFEFDSPTFSGDFESDKTLVVRLDAPQGQAFSVSPIDPWDTDIHIRAVISSVVLEEALSLTGTCAFEMVVGVSPTPVQIVSLYYDEAGERILMGAQYAIPSGADVAFSRIEMRFDLPSDCDASFQDLPFFGGFYVWSHTDGDPGTWAGLEELPVPNEDLSWGRLKASYRE